MAITLKKYGEKRRFETTPEPPAVEKAGTGTLAFVVQKHAARQLHYDLRLELDDVLKSWAIPAGPSLNPAEKRLAVMVEDHPVDYANFEGIIPKGEYGAGQVIVWDNGDYSPEKDGNLFFDDRSRAQEYIRQGLEKGKISFTLRGRKLNGSWTLVKMQKTKDSWLLMKHKDDFADTKNDVLEKGKSVLSGLTIDDLKAGKLPSREVVDKLSEIPGIKKESFPTRITPMLASLASKSFSDPDWIFEPKLDGYRVIATINLGKVTLISRNGIDITRHYPPIAESLKKQSASNLILDGEVIALDQQGKQCFQCLQGFLDAMHHRKTTEKTSAVIYYVFDILYLDGFSLFEVPLIKRKELLERTLVPSREVKLIEHFEGDGKVIFQSAVEQGLEGIVAKRKDSHYTIGKRSPDWLKIKSTLSDDFIVGGYTQGTGSRANTFGSLLLGYFDQKNRLIPAGNVGTGFDERRLTELKKQLDELQAKKSPFTSEPELTGPVTWVKPVLMAEVKFAEWTRDGRLRAPVFLRLRDDKPPEQVHIFQTKVIKDLADSQHTQKGAPKQETNSLLRQLKNTGNEFILDIDGHKIELSNLNKELWPAVADRKGLTKREFLVYLTRVAPYFLKHLANRPITLKRYPDGINGMHFFQKHWNGTIPDFVETVTLSEQRKKGEYILCNNLPTLIWLGQLADIEFHTWFSRLDPKPDIVIPKNITDKIDKIDYLSRYPDFIIFDLDPYIYSGTELPGEEPQLSREAFNMTGQVSLWLKELLDELSLSSFIKTSGMTGLHIHVPILRQLDFDVVRSSAKTICEYILKRHPKYVTTEWAVEKRRGKIFLDYNQNVRGKTLASVYSPRPSPAATVSTPLRWDEISKVYPTDFTIVNLPDRLTKLGDLWADILHTKRDIKKLLKLT